MKTRFVVCGWWSVGELVGGWMVAGVGGSGCTVLDVDVDDLERFLDTGDIDDEVDGGDDDDSETRSRSRIRIRSRSRIQQDQTSERVSE